MARKDGSDGDDDRGDFKGQKRCNDTHQSTSDPDAKLYRKGKTGSELHYMGHTLSDNRHGLVVNARVSQADGYAEREAAKVMLNDARQATIDPDTEVTVGADKGYDAQEFIETCLAMKVTPHVAQNKSGRRSAVPEAIASSEGLRSRSKSASSLSKALAGSKQSGACVKSWCAD